MSDLVVVVPVVVLLLFQAESSTVDYPFVSSFGIVVGFLLSLGNDVLTVHDVLDLLGLFGLLGWEALSHYAVPSANFLLIETEA